MGSEESEDPNAEAPWQGLAQPRSTVASRFRNEEVTAAESGGSLGLPSDRELHEGRPSGLPYAQVLQIEGLREILE